jgi:hypothetical protein
MPKPYRNANASAGLRTMVARLKGELKKLDRQRAKLEQELAKVAAQRAQRANDLEHVGQSLLLLQPDIVLADIAPVVPAEPAGHLGYGTLRSEILAVLKEAEDWLTGAQLHEAIVRRKNIVFANLAERQKHLQHLREALHVMANRTPPQVEREHKLTIGGPTILQRWRLGAMFRLEREAEN